MTDKTPAPIDAEFQKEMATLRPAQRERASAIAKAIMERATAPAMTLANKGGTLTVTFGGKSPDMAILLQMADLGVADGDFHQGIVSQMAALGARGRSIDEANTNFVMAVARSIQPKDAIEAMLATQMGAIHIATMMLAARLHHVDTLPQQDSASRALNQLARTYAMQVDALKRYRTGGQQKVTVEHVTVNAGGQAIVGAVATGAAGNGGGGPQ